MFNEKVIQISDHRLLTNKGRLFEEFLDIKGEPYWTEVKLPDFKAGFSTERVKGNVSFVENVSKKERWEKTKTINDLINEEN